MTVTIRTSCRRVGRTGYALLVHLPDGYKPEQVASALAAKIQTQPDTLRRSLAWDQGPEMRDWKQVHIDAGSTSTSVTPNHPGNAGATTPVAATKQSP